MRASLRGLCVPLCLLLFLAARAGAQQPALPSFDALEWRHIGPAAFGGRIADVQAVRGTPSTIFVAAASGGIFRTRNHGVTWEPVFDRSGGALSIGALAIAPSDPNIIWAGTGEPNNRQSSSWGDGVYRSIDGGDTWRHMGLKESHHIGRVAIHPRNPDIVYVAALGHLWGPNPDRGVYRTRDGGRTWDHVLKVDEDTGAVDLALDEDGRTIFAATYQRRRRAWGFVGGGPGSGLHRSLDGGDSWERLQHGLPQGDIGRIGVRSSPSRPEVVYAIIEHKEGGVFRSVDRGTTWTRQNSLNPRPMYYSKIRVDPQNAERVWVLGSPLYLSIDGGKSFRSDDTAVDVHVDHHALWIDPDNPDHLMLGNDGGLYFSYDGSRSWHFADNLPIGQYYDIGIDGRDPYWIFGGTQDNGTWAIPSRTSSLLGVTNLDVLNVAYGDGFYTVPDRANSRFTYANSQNGRAYRVDLETREEQGIRPVPEDPKEVYRFNWSTPMLLSPHDPKVLYYGGNRLFRTGDGGHSWQVISPDLTRNQDWKKLPIMGPERSEATLSRDDGVADYGTITTISESPIKRGLLYVGTDDGRVQMSVDGGGAWQDLTSRFTLPGERWVSRVLASRHAADAALVTFDGHQDDDFAPYVFRTTNGGRTWASIAGDLPHGVVVNTIEEHPRTRDLLLAGTESGLYVTFNGGRNWSRLGGTLPAVPIDDIIVTERENDIVLGTHGRSIIILDDMAALEHLTPETLEALASLFPMRTATQYYEQRRLPTPAASKYSGPNPPYGALITYHLREDLRAAPTTSSAESSGNGGSTNGEQETGDAARPQVKISVHGPGGELVRELEGPGTRGLHRVAWDLRYPTGFSAADSDQGWFGPPRGTFVLPGTYTVRLVAGTRELKQPVEVRVDPRSQATAAALEARFRASTQAADIRRAFVEAAERVQAAETQLVSIRKMVDGRNGVPDEVTRGLKTFAASMDDLKERFKSGWGGPRFRIFDLHGQLQASTVAPTEAQMRSLDQLFASVTEGVELLNRVTTVEFLALHKALQAAGIVAELGKAVEPPRRD